MLSIFCSRIQGYMLSLMNEVDLCLLLSLCVLYEIQNQIFQQLKPRKPHLVAYLMLNNVGHRAIHLRQLRSLGPGPCWIRGNTK